MVRSSDRWWAWTGRLPSPLRRLLSQPFVRFLIVGGLNTLFSYCIFALLLMMGIPYPLAVLIASIVGILFNFRTYGALVFGSHDDRLLLRFFAVYAVCYLLNLAPLAWARHHGLSLYVAGAVVAIPVAFVAYTLNRLFVFRKTEDTHHLPRTRS